MGLGLRACSKSALVILQVGRHSRPTLFYILLHPPSALTHIDTPVLLKCHPFRTKQRRLIQPMRSRTPRSIDNPMARHIRIHTYSSQNPTDKTRPPRLPRQRRHIAIRTHTSAWNSTHHIPDSQRKLDTTGATHRPVIHTICNILHPHTRAHYEYAAKILN